VPCSSRWFVTKVDTHPPDRSLGGSPLTKCWFRTCVRLPEGSEALRDGRANFRVKLPSRRMVARRPSRLALRFRTAARRPQAVMKIGQAARRAAARRVKPARALREGR